MTPAVADGVHELVEVWIGGGGGGDEVEVAMPALAELSELLPIDSGDGETVSAKYCTVC